ncbi:hypothetical protein D3C71_1347220 [compost metagenome]
MKTTAFRGLILWTIVAALLAHAMMSHMALLAAEPPVGVLDWMKAWWPLPIAAALRQAYFERARLNKIARTNPHDRTPSR